MNFRDYFYLLRYSIAKKGAISAFNNAITHQQLDEQELQELTWNKTKRLLTHAYEKVEWYNKTFKKNDLHPNDISKPEYFSQVPILKRHDLINNFEEFIAKGTKSKDLNFITTGGSSGEPLKIGVSKSRIREVQKPKIIHGYVGAMDAIADYILENNISFNFRPNAIWLTAAPITNLQEQKISRAFNNASICDQYGCSEIYFVASECSNKKGLHIFSDSVKVEIVNKNEELVNFNEHGKIILTNLDEYLFPLIRYENGDEGRLLKEKCGCGLSLPLLDKVKGRISDNIILSDNTILSGEYLTTIFDDYTANVKQFQIIQAKDLSITVKICLYEPNDSDFIRNEIYNKLGLIINNQAPFKVDFVGDIKSDKGKLRFIIKEN